LKRQSPPLTLLRLIHSYLSTRSKKPNNVRRSVFRKPNKASLYAVSVRWGWSSRGPPPAPVLGISSLCTLWWTTMG